MTSSPATTPTGQPADLLNDQIQLLRSIEARLATNEQAQKQIIQKLASLETIQKEANDDITDVSVTDVDIPFGSMVGLMIKWAFAAIPAGIVIGLIFGGFYLLFAIFILGLLHH
jgi:hypothetical protein